MSPIEHVTNDHWILPHYYKDLCWISKQFLPMAMVNKLNSVTTHLDCNVRVFWKYWSTPFVPLCLPKWYPSKSTFSAKNTVTTSVTSFSSFSCIRCLCSDAFYTLDITGKSKQVWVKWKQQRQLHSSNGSDGGREFTGMGTASVAQLLNITTMGVIEAGSSRI